MLFSLYIYDIHFQLGFFESTWKFGYRITKQPLVYHAHASTNELSGQTMRQCLMVCRIKWLKSLLGDCIGWVRIMLAVNFLYFLYFHACSELMFWIHFSKLFQIRDSYLCKWSLCFLLIKCPKNLYRISFNVHLGP